MNALRRAFGKKNKHLVQSIALALMVVIPVLLYFAAGAGALAGLYALLAVLAVVMGLTTAVS